ncbi:neutral zinc metallopeptidase [Microbacterium sp.]|uniref:KPN_02809 family neutral zinc metallopeptidase n=1 Tax=Microbacterium sp. TaxID=51671 RepID=UPI0039E5DE5D
MTFNNNADVGGNTAKRRGRTTAVAGGGVVGLGAIVVIILNLVTGGDFASLLGGDAGTQTAQQGAGTEVANCETGADANANIDCRIAAAQLVLDGYWEQQVQNYRSPQLVIVDGQTSTACGTASNATGPFYCPPEETVYIDPTFFDLLRSQFGAEAGNLAQLYVVGHEWGHHIQQIMGIMDQYPSNGTGPASNGVRTELQADCFAGAWIADAATVTDGNGVAYLQQPTEAQLRDALNAAASVGDDHIQQQSGSVNPESWTHGSSEQRQRWFATGYKSGLGACDTFAVSGSQL